MVLPLLVGNDSHLAIACSHVWKMRCQFYFVRPLSIVGAGRTDAGVHAHQLFAHVDIDEHIDQDLTFRLNKLLPKEIAVRSIIPVIQDAHARFDAVSRSYCYQITTQKNPFLQKRSYQFAKPLDVELMNQAAKILIDHEDFKCFSKSKTDVKTYTYVIFNMRTGNKMEVNWFSLYRQIGF